MLLDIECKNCESDFEIDTESLLEESDTIKCPNCKSKVSGKMTEDFVSALEDTIALMAQLRKKFMFTIALDTDDEELFGEAEEEDDTGWDAEEELVEEDDYDEDL